MKTTMLKKNSQTKTMTNHRFLNVYSKESANWKLVSANEFGTYNPNESEKLLIMQSAHVPNQRESSVLLEEDFNPVFFAWVIFGPSDNKKHSLTSLDKLYPYYWC